MEHGPAPCPYLWGQPVLTVDGNMAPCRGVFQGFDDVTHLAASPDEPGARSFDEAWNHPRYQAARGFFHQRDASADRDIVCHDCPTTIFYERWRAHRSGGGTLATFDPGMVRHANGAWNFFWARGQRPPGRPDGGREVGGPTLESTAVSAASGR